MHLYAGGISREDYGLRVFESVQVFPSSTAERERASSPSAGSVAVVRPTSQSARATGMGSVESNWAGNPVRRARRERVSVSQSVGEEEQR